MRNILGFGIALTAACLAGAPGTARGQAGGPATPATNLEQTVNQQAAASGAPAASSAVPGVTTTAPGGTAAVPGANTAASGIAGNQAGNPNAAPNTTGSPTNADGMPGTQAGMVPGAVNSGTTYTPGIANPGMSNNRSNAPNTPAARRARDLSRHGHGRDTGLHKSGDAGDVRV